MEQPLIITGLGNPGREYEKTRHNLGFMVLDACAGSAARWRKSAGGLWSEIRLIDRRVFLLKPQRFMNQSGPVVRDFLEYYHLDCSSLVVVHDDLDLPLGALRFRESGGDGGHNGVKSLISSLESADFVRLKLGIGRPVLPAELPAEDTQALERLVTDWVLNSFSREELPTAEQSITRAVAALEEYSNAGLKAAQNRFNG